MQNLIIYKLKSLYQILEEIHLNLEFNFLFIENESKLKNLIKNLNNYLVILKKKKQKKKKQKILKIEPMNILNLI